MKQGTQRLAHSLAHRGFESQPVFLRGGFPAAGLGSIDVAAKTIVRFMGLSEKSSTIRPVGLLVEPPLGMHSAGVFVSSPVLLGFSKLHRKD